MALPPFQGVHPALITPFRDGAVDLRCFRDLAERQIAAGVDGLVVCGTTGETPTLTAAEWEALVAAAVEVADGRVPVTAGCGTNNTATTAANVARAAALGADAALVVLPYYNKPNRAGHLAHMAAAAGAGLPVVAYHVPGRTGQRVPVDLLAALADLEGVAAVKEATGDVSYGSALIARTDTPVLSGDDFTCFPLQCVGGAGVISVIANLDPHRSVRLYRAAAASRLPEARALHHALMPLVAYLFSDTNPAPVKAAMAQLGLCRPEVRLPLAPAAEPPPADALAGVER